MLSFSRSIIRCKYKTNAGENEGLKRKYGLGNEGPPQGMYCRQRRGEKLDVEYVERSELGCSPIRIRESECHPPE